MLRSNSFEGIMPLVSPLVTIVWNVRGVTAAALTSPQWWSPGTRHRREDGVASRGP